MKQDWKLYSLEYTHILKVYFMMHHVQSHHWHPQLKGTLKPLLIEMNIKSNNGILHHQLHPSNGCTNLPQQCMDNPRSCRLPNSLGGGLRHGWDQEVLYTHAMLWLPKQLRKFNPLLNTTKEFSVENSEPFYFDQWYKTIFNWTSTSGMKI